MPRPRHQPGGARPKATRQFTDREEYVEAFEKAVSELPLKENKVLVYYGVGGIGKIELRKELGRRLDKNYPHVAWATLDFETPTHRDVEGALSWLGKEELTPKYRVLFPSFQLALFQYWRKSYPHTPLRTDELPLLAEADTLAELINIGADIPGMAFVAKSVRLGLKARQWLKEWWTKKGQRQLYELEDMIPKNIEERLPMFWAGDLKSFMKDQS